VLPKTKPSTGLPKVRNVSPNRKAKLPSATVQRSQTELGITPVSALLMKTGKLSVDKKRKIMPRGRIATATGALYHESVAGPIRVPIANLSPNELTANAQPFGIRGKPYLNASTATSLDQVTRHLAGENK